MLPSGRHVGLSPERLVKLFENADHFGNVHKIMAIQEFSDLCPWIDVLSFVSKAKLEDMDTGTLSDNSLPAPPGLVAVKCGYRLNDWEVHAADWSEADRESMRSFLDDRAREHFEQHLDYARSLQTKLRSAEAGVLAKILATWHDVGVHPAQEEGWPVDGEAAGEKRRRDGH